MSLKTELISVLNTQPAVKLDKSFTDYACVAMIILDNNPTQIGFIRRAITPTDRWSGQMAFPGGRRESFDADDFATALREVQEEIGLDLSRADLVGGLDDVQARRAGQLLPFFIRPFVFCIDERPFLNLDPREVDSFHWVPIKSLLDPSEHINFPYSHEGTPVQLPGIRMPSQDILWGLTYMMVTNFLVKTRQSEAISKHMGFPENLKYWRNYP